MVEKTIQKFKPAKDKLIDNLNCKFNDELKALLDKKSGEKVLGSFEVEIAKNSSDKKSRVFVISKYRIFFCKPNYDAERKPHYSVNPKRIHHGAFIRGFTFCEGVNECVLHIRAKPDYHIFSEQYQDIKQCL